MIFNLEKLLSLHKCKLLCVCGGGGVHAMLFEAVTFLLHMILSEQHDLEAQDLSRYIRC